MPKVKAIIGANYGDEGKGLATAWFASKTSKGAVVLTNGGPQRGHTVESMTTVERHVFHHHCSSLKPVDFYMPSQFLVNPLEFIREKEELDKQNWKYGQAIISPDCLVTTPYDMFVNQVLEIHRGAKKHGSCGFGIWATICRDKEIHLSFTDIIDGKIESKLDAISDYSLYVLEKEGVKAIPNEYMTLFKSNGLKKHFLNDCRHMLSEVKVEDESFLNNYEDVIFENSQGLLLSKVKGDPHTTPSFTGMENINEICTHLDVDDAEICYVSRTYLTRHGVGPFPSECKKEELNPGIIDLTNQPNKWQDSLRYGRLDISELNRRIFQDFNKCIIPNAMKSVMLTHFNELQIDKSKVEDLRYISSSKFFDTVEKFEKV